MLIIAENVYLKIIFFFRYNTSPGASLGMLHVTYENYKFVSCNISFRRTTFVAINYP